MSVSSHLWMIKPSVSKDLDSVFPAAVETLLAHAESTHYTLKSFPCEKFRV